MPMSFHDYRLQKCIAQDTWSISENSGMGNVYKFLFYPLPDMGSWDMAFTHFSQNQQQSKFFSYWLFTGSYVWLNIIQTHDVNPWWPKSVYNLIKLPKVQLNSLMMSLLFVKQTVAETVGDWYFKREAAMRIDCPFPCNPTCYNRDLTVGWCNECYLISSHSNFWLIFLLEPGPVVDAAFASWSLSLCIIFYDQV